MPGNTLTTQYMMHSPKSTFLHDPEDGARKIGIQHTCEININCCMLLHQMRILTVTGGDGLVVGGKDKDKVDDAAAHLSQILLPTGVT